MIIIAEMRTLERDGCMGEPGPGNRRWMEKGFEVEYWGQGKVRRGDNIIWL